jgi:hypothetical protein
MSFPLCGQLKSKQAQLPLTGSTFGTSAFNQIAAWTHKVRTHKYLMKGVTG